MAVTPSLTVLNNLAALNNQGITITAKGGNPQDAFLTGYSPTITGNTFQKAFQLNTATVATLFNSATDTPATWVYAHLWTSQICALQVIGSTTNYSHQVGLQLPWVASTMNFLAAANTSIITGGSQPSWDVIVKLVIGNYSGSLAYGILTLVQ